MGLTTSVGSVQFSSVHRVVSLVNQEGVQLIRYKVDSLQIREENS